MAPEDVQEYPVDTASSKQALSFLWFENSLTPEQENLHCVLRLAERKPGG
jgi:hypothetical protein